MITLIRCVFLLLLLSRFLFAQGDSLLEEAALHAAIRKAKEQKDAALLADMYYNLASQKGISYDQRDSILFYLVRSEELYRQLGDTAGLIGTFNELSYYYQTSKEYDRAIDYLQKIRKYAVENKDTSRLINFHLALGNIYAIQEKLPADSVFYHYQLAESFAQATRDTMDMLVMNYHFAVEYLYRDTLLEEARQRLKQALELEPHTIEGQYFLPAIQEHLGDYFLRKKRYTEAIASYQQAISGGEQFEDATLLRACYEKLKTCYLALGQYEQAVAAMEQKQTYQEIIFDEEKMRSIERLEMEFETERKDNAIALLEQEKAAKDLQAQRQRSLIFVILTGLILISVIAVLLILNYRYRIKANRAKAEQQEAINRLQKNFYTNITHEFRTPITVIQGMAEQIRGNPKEKMLIQRNSQNLLRLVNQLLDLSKLDEGKLELQPIQSDIISFLRYVTESLQSMAASKGIHLIFNTTTEQLVMDYDPDKMQQILHNLLSNAIQHTPPEGTVQLLTQKNDQQLQLQVMDNGKGIPTEDLPHIFERFYQVGNNRQTSQGTGIGLAVVKELVQLMHGSIEVDSRLGEGSVFTLSLPISRKAPLQTAQMTIAP